MPRKGDPQGADPSSAPNRRTKPTSRFRYDLEIDMSTRSTQARVVRLVGNDKRVLELGCATGYMSRVLRERGCRVVAIEIDGAAAARAAGFCERVIVGDIDRVNFAQELGDDLFDVVVAADVLEHLKDPARALRRIRPHLTQGGRVVASIPNIAHGSVRLALLAGTFPYSEVGLLDRSHLRFFTRESVEQLFSDAGFSLTYVHRQRRAIERSEVPFNKEAVPREAVEAVVADTEALTYQFIVAAEADPDAEQEDPEASDVANQEAESPEVAGLRQVVDQLQEANASLERRVAAADRQLKALKTAKRRAALERAALSQDMEDRESNSSQRIHDLSEEVRVARDEIESLVGTLREREEQLKRRLIALWSLSEEQEHLQTRIRDLERERDAASEERDEAQRSLSVARREGEAIVRLLDGMRQNQELVEQQHREIAELRRKVIKVADRETNLREMLLDAHAQMIHRDEEFQAILSEVLRRSESSRGVSADRDGYARSVPSKRLRYQELTREIHEAVEGCIPRDATVLVISKGDPELLKQGGRRAWHFPRTTAGEYAGFHPANSEDAIAHLEDLRTKGGEFLLLPATSFWWLEHYADFRRHLESHYRTVADIKDVCMIVDVRAQLAPPETAEGVGDAAAANGHGGGRRKLRLIHRSLRAPRRTRSAG